MCLLLPYNSIKKVPGVKLTIFYLNNTMQMAEDKTHSFVFGSVGQMYKLKALAFGILLFSVRTSVKLKLLVLTARYFQDEVCDTIHGAYDCLLKCLIGKDEIKHARELFQHCALTYGAFVLVTSWSVYVPIYYVFNI